VKYWEISRGVISGKGLGGRKVSGEGKVLDDDDCNALGLNEGEDTGR